MPQSDTVVSSRVAFTLLEICIVLAVIGILATMLIPVYAGMRTHAQRVQCIANLHNLYIAADLFVQRNGSWPQITRTTSDTGAEDYANAWIDTLSPFGPTRQTLDLSRRPGSAAQPRLLAATNRATGLQSR